MDKISSILPSTPRMSTDDSVAPPARPGAPENGRPNISSETRDKVSISSLKTSLPTKSEKDAEQVKMIENLNRKFFMNKPDKSSKSDKLSTSEKISPSDFGTSFKENNEQLEEFLTR